MSEHGSKDNLHCIHCGSVSNLSHYPSCPNYGLYDKDGNAIPVYPKVTTQIKVTEEELYYDTPRGAKMPQIDESMGRHPAGKKLPLKPIEEILERTNVKPQQYVRKPFFVDAVQVTLDNIDAVAKWCEGKVITDTHQPPYIKVKVKRPLAERQTRAFVGDWVLSSGNGYKVYTQSSFEKNFEDVEEKSTMSKALSEQLEFFLGKLDEKLGS